MGFEARIRQQSLRFRRLEIHDNLTSTKHSTNIVDARLLLVITFVREILHILFQRLTGVRFGGLKMLP